MKNENLGSDKTKIEELKERLTEANKTYDVIESEDNCDEYLNFYFIGVYEDQEVIYDAVIYTLRLQHESELYEIAEHEAAKKFPSFKKIKYEEDENGDMHILDGYEEEVGLFMAETIIELEEEASVKVKEHIEVDENIDFGIGLDVGLNVEIITHEVVHKFIENFNKDNLKLDDTLYSFEIEDEEELSE